MKKMAGSVLLLFAFSALCYQVPAENITVVNGKWIQFTARPDGYVLVDENESCKKGTPGLRYWVKDDPSIIRIEDKRENFVGTQTGIYKKEILETVPEGQRDAAVKWYENNDQIQIETIGEKEETVYLMTGYIYDPESICSGPHTEKSTHVYIKDTKGENGGYREANRSDEKSLSPVWEKNPCVPSMGDHYRPKTPALDDPECTGWRPAFLLFSDGYCIGYGWQQPGVIDKYNFERPPRHAIASAIDPMPECIMKSFDDNKGYNSQHIYVMDGKPQEIPCP